MVILLNPLFKPKITMLISTIQVQLQFHTAMSTMVVLTIAKSMQSIWMIALSTVPTLAPIR